MMFLSRGYMERTFFGIDSLQVGMAVLVQPLLDSDSVVANGILYSLLITFRIC